MPRLRLGLQQDTDVVGMGLAVWQGGVCQLVWLLTDVVVVVTHPFLAAATLGAGQAGSQTAPVRQGHLLRTEGHAADHPVHTSALVLTAGLEVFTVLVHPPAELTGQTMGLSSTQSSLRVSSCPQVAA